MVSHSDVLPPVDPSLYTSPISNTDTSPARTGIRGESEHPQADILSKDGGGTGDQLSREQQELAFIVPRKRRYGELDE